MNLNLNSMRMELLFSTIHYWKQLEKRLWSAAEYYSKKPWLRRYKVYLIRYGFSFNSTRPKAECNFDANQTECNVTFTRYVLTFIAQVLFYTYLYSVAYTGYSPHPYVPLKIQHLWYHIWPFRCALHMDNCLEIWGKLPPSNSRPKSKRNIL